MKFDNDSIKNAYESLSNKMQNAIAEYSTKDTKLTHLNIDDYSVNAIVTDIASKTYTKMIVLISGTVLTKTFSMA